jgi:hypothetical protein
MPVSPVNDEEPNNDGDGSSNDETSVNSKVISLSRKFIRLCPEPF